MAIASSPPGCAQLLRAIYLDEMARRDPSGFAHWIAAASHHYRDPTPYINSTRHHDHPGQ